MKKKFLLPLLLVAIIAAMVCVTVFAVNADTVEPCPDGQHQAGAPATCFGAQKCTVCGIELAPKLDHVWGDEPTCVKAQECKLCGEPNPEAPATGIHSPDRDEATCEDPIKCKVCRRNLKAALGHTPEDSEGNCGEGQQCLTCHKFLVNATGDCTIDWSDAEVIRAATANAYGLIKGTCSECGCSIERSVAYEKTSYEVYAHVSGLTNIPAGVTFHSTVKKIADVGEIEIEKKYQLIQGMTLSMVDEADNSYDLGAKTTVTILANNTTNKLNAECLKVYLQTADGIKEISFKLTNDGKTVELELDQLGTILIAANVKMAKEILGQ